MDINQRKLQLTTQPESMHMQEGEKLELSSSSVGKTEKEFVVDAENLKTINKIVPIAGNSNSSQGPSNPGVVSHKMKRDMFQKVSW